MCKKESVVANSAHLVPLNMETVNGVTLGIQPGDTIYILAGLRSLLYFKDIHGDSLHPIIIINKGGAVLVENNNRQYGIRVAHSYHFRFTGTGVDTILYGIRIMQSALNCNGLSLDDMSTNFEVDHFEIANTGFAGINSKTQPTCDCSANRGNFTQYHVSFHHNYIHDTGGEAMYIGHSYYTGYPTTCNGVPTVLYPHDIIGMRIFRNIIENTYLDGIQVGCVVEDCEIFDNTVKNYGTGLIDAQNAGIQVGGGTTGKCYNNYIANGSGIGINVFGTGNNLVYNNLIINAGLNYFPGDSTKYVHGIFCSDKSTVPGRFFSFINNTIVNVKTDGIRFKSVLSANNEIRNNIIIHPGSYGWYSNPSYCYINLMTTIPVTLSNNYTSRYSKNLNFRDTVNFNFRIRLNSPAKDAGTDVSVMGITYDKDSLFRPYSVAFDIGAFEYHPENIWMGGKSNQWNDPENWSEFSVPLSDDHVVIPGNTTFNPEIVSGTYTCNNLTINSGAQLLLDIQAQLTIIGNLTIESDGILTNNGTIILKGDLANLN